MAAESIQAPRSSEGALLCAELRSVVGGGMSPAGDAARTLPIVVVDADGKHS
jgi:hypothetical protein